MQNTFIKDADFRILRINCAYEPIQIFDTSKPLVTNMACLFFYCNRFLSQRCPDVTL